MGSAADKGLVALSRRHVPALPPGQAGRVGQEVPMASIPMVNLVVAGFVSIVAGGLFLGALNAHRGRRP
jgi:energy-converting hydrogenase Eha subunit C